MDRHKHIVAQRERGAALVFALCLLVAILLLGVSAAQMALQGERSARGERDRQIAFQAAEEALMDAEHDIEGEGSPGAPGRSSLFAADSAAGFAEGCAGGEPGLCLPAASGAPPVWLSKDLGLADSAAGTVAYGQFTGASMQTGAGFLPFRRPRYLIELLPFHRPGEEAGASAGEPAAGYLYRVTAIGFGAQEDTQVVLQTFYRKQAAGEAP